MGIKFLTKNCKTQLGFDITPEGIIAVSLKKDGSKTCLQNLVFKPFFSEVIQNGIIANFEEFEDVISQFKNEECFQTEKVSICIPGNSAFIKTMNFPNIPEDELRIIVPQEINKHLPVSIAEVNYDFEIIRQIKNPSGQISEIEVVLVAIQKNIVKMYTEAFHKAGFHVTAVDIAPFSVIRTLAHVGMIDESENLDISVFIGHETTDINIIYKGMPIFFDNIPVGKKNIIETLSSDLEISLAEAKKLLNDVSLIVPGMEVNMDTYLAKAAGSVRSEFNHISSEILKVIEFFTSQTSNSPPIRKIIVSGTGVCVKNIDKYFSHRVKIETHLCNPFENFDNSKIQARQDSDFSKKLINGKNDRDQSVKFPVFATAVGLALKG